MPLQLGQNLQNNSAFNQGYGAAPNQSATGQQAGDSSVFGTSNSPGWLGSGQYVAPAYNINQTAFQNPAGNLAPAYQQQAQNYLAQANIPVNAQGSNLGGANYGNFNSGINGQQTAGQGQLGAAGMQAGIASRQLGLAGQYQNMAAGGGPSLATVMAGQQGAQNLQQQESMLGSARGAGNPAQAQLAARNALTGGQQQVAQNAVAGRTQEEMAALQGAGQQYGAAANTGANIGQTYGGAGSTFGNISGQGLQQAGQTLQNQQFNASQNNAVQQGNQQTNLAANTNLLQNLSAQDLAQLQAQMGGQQLGVQQQLGLDQTQQQAYASAAGNNSNVAGSIMGGLGGALGGLAGML